MPTTILLLSDIHANFPALAAIDRQADSEGFDLILNGGDTVVYGPFPNETLDWLRSRRALSILGNTDRKVLELHRVGIMAKPRKPEKRIMYTWTSEHLTSDNLKMLDGLPKRLQIECDGFRIGLFHGSPSDDDEFLFDTTPAKRFGELALAAGCDIVICGHSHTPFHKQIDGVHFINPGSVGRMFDGVPDGSYATLNLAPGWLRVALHRCPYPVDQVISGLRVAGLPDVYEEMFRSGRKLN